ncbi:hypothetical protein Anas_05589 [Armadillidium nasatum]|uniref:Ras-GEF domain-containing protein n=1 Tax=Armadillidium nasatum TaxID=96803 RepID=A0A5N5SSY3_9CRUS|nr:hypothetical protein Anas_05589 [Armadillidium nasatum]
MISKDFESDGNLCQMTIEFLEDLTPSRENIETLSAMDIAEQMTYIDHQIFMSRLVVSEIVRRATLPSRISVIEKWVAVADICRVLHNFNGVLQTRQTLDKLQALIAHVIREIRHFQQTPYKIEHIPRVCSYLLDTTLLYTDDELYKLSLEMEPRRMTLAHVSVPSTTGSSTPTSTTSS